MNIFHNHKLLKFAIKTLKVETFLSNNFPFAKVFAKMTTMLTLIAGPYWAITFIAGQIRTKNFGQKQKINSTTT